MGKKIYGLLGRKLGHSWSVPIHKALGCEDYRLIELEPEQLEAFLRREDIGGLNVTIPYKRDVMKFCDVIDPAAEAIGSVNTLVRRDGKLCGCNTDIDGLLYMLRRAKISLAGKKVVILGSGGASLTAQAAAQQEGAREVVVVSRTGPDNYENLPDRHKDAQVLINTTPVGMWPHVKGLSLDLKLLPGITAAADVIYNPVRTNLLLQAEALDREARYWEEADVAEPPGSGLRRVQYTGGLPMLVSQAKRAEELFFDRTIPDSETEAIVSRLWQDTTNIALVGMPGSGKTTVGRALARLSGKPFVDLDEEIVRKAGKPIPEIFAQEGEGTFRAMENEVLEEVCAKSGQIIATGGGAVLWSENRAAMRRTGRVYFLRRDLSRLPTDGRPLSQAGKLEEMFRLRGPLYEQSADQSVQNDSSPEETAAAIWNDYRAHAGGISMKILVINGPNMNMLGIRQPEIYGSATYEDLKAMIREEANRLGVEVSFFQSNHEGALVDAIQQAYFDKVDGIIINPAAYTHTSVALLDAVKAVGIPTVEVHVSDPDSREEFRHVSYIRAACVGTVRGHGLPGYLEALRMLAQ